MSDAQDLGLPPEALEVLERQPKLAAALAAAFRQLQASAGHIDVSIDGAPNRPLVFSVNVTLSPGRRGRKRKG